MKMNHYIDAGGNMKKALAKNAKADAKNIFHDRKFAKEPIILVNYHPVTQEEVGQLQVF